MEDINPAFVPRAIPARTVLVARPDKGKGKAKDQPSAKPTSTSTSVNLLAFFCKSAHSAPPSRLPSPPPLSSPYARARGRVCIAFAFEPF